jgi:hypothetical protein
MALVTVVSSHIYGLFAVGFFTHINKFIQIGSLFKSLRKDPDVARKLYGWFKDINHENDRRFAIKVAAIRTLYKLSQVQLT